MVKFNIVHPLPVLGSIIKINREQLFIYYMVVRTYNLSTGEMKKASLGYVVRPCLKGKHTTGHSNKLSLLWYETCTLIFIICLITFTHLKFPFCKACRDNT